MDMSIIGDATPAVDRRLGGRKDVRIRIVFDDQVNMNMAATVNLSDDGLLMAAGVDLALGTRVTIFPLEDKMDDASLFELKGEVVRSFEDIMVSAYADDRFQMGIRLDLSEKQKNALQKYMVSSKN